jgi:hypothetical protein
MKMPLHGLYILLSGVVIGWSIVIAVILPLLLLIYLVEHLF